MLPSVYKQIGSCDLFTHIRQGRYIGTEAISRKLGITTIALPVQLT